MHGCIICVGHFCTIQTAPHIFTYSMQYDVLMLYVNVCLLIVYGVTVYMLYVNACLLIGFYLLGGEASPPPKKKCCNVNK